MPTYQTIIQTSNSTNTDPPVQGDISQGELAINLVDGTLYIKDTGNSIRTVNKIAASNADTSEAGAVSSFISENSFGVGINKDAVSGIDLSVNGDVAIGGNLDVGTIFRNVTNDSVKLSGGTSSGTDGANIELYGNTASPTEVQNNAYIDAEEFYVRDIGDANTKYLALGTSAPKINIGGSNTISPALLQIGVDRTGDGGAQIEFQSLITDATIKPHILRDTAKDFKIVNHGTGSLILSADTNEKIMLQTTASDSATVDHVSLVARDGFVRVGNLTTSDDVTSNELEVTGDVQADSITLTDDDSIFLGSNQHHLITHTDGTLGASQGGGTGVINIRGGHKVDQSGTPQEEYTNSGVGAAYIGGKNLGNITAATTSSTRPKIELKVGSDTSVTTNDAVNWGTALTIEKDRASFEGKVGIKYAFPQGDLHVVGSGGSDNILFEANAGSTTAGARITLRTSAGTSPSSKGNSINNSNLGEVNFQGYQGAAYAPGAKIIAQAANAWSSSTVRSARLLFKVRQANVENTALRLFGTDGGKASLNSGFNLINVNDPTLAIGANQKLSKDADSYIEHLRLDAATGYGVENDNPSGDGNAANDINNRDRLIFRHYRKTTDDTTPTSQTARFRIQRLDVEDNSTSGPATNRFNGFIDFGHDQNVAGLEDMITFGKGAIGSSSEYFRIDNSGRLTQYGTNAENVNDSVDDLTIGSDSNNATGMTILSSQTGKGSINFHDSASVSGVRGLISYDHANDHLSLSTNGEGFLDADSEAYNGMTIGSNGFVGIGLTGTNPTISQRLHVNGQILAEQDITAFSDERLKENITTIPNALEKVTQLRGVQYTRKDTQEEGIGVIAQEIEKVLPEVVVTNDDEDKTKSVAYGNVVGLLIEAVKDLQKEVEELKRNVTN